MKLAVLSVIFEHFHLIVTMYQTFPLNSVDTSSQGKIQVETEQMETVAGNMFHQTTITDFIILRLP